MRNWVSLIGDFAVESDVIRFTGGTTINEQGVTLPFIGNFISNEFFAGGEISCSVRFGSSVEDSAAGLILGFNAATKGFHAVYLGNSAFCTLAEFNGERWLPLSDAGPKSQLKPDTKYDLRVRVVGSRVVATVNGVDLLDHRLNTPLPGGQAGLWARSLSQVEFGGFNTAAKKPTLFVVMQFTKEFNELYEDVIDRVGDVLGFSVVRADTTYGPGLIIADIQRQIVEAGAIVAEITPPNPNVFWEVGFAHALRKPTILLAEKDTKLPFDVSPFRVLFYENTIAGKKRIEEGLMKHLKAIISG